MKSHVKVLAATLAVSVALVGAGYAAWGTEITSTTKMQTGEWNIVLENDAPGDSYLASDSVGYFTRTGDVLSGAVAYNGTWENDGTYDIDGAINPNAKDFVYVIEPIPAPSDLDDGGIQGAGEAHTTACTFQFNNLHPGTKAITRFEMRNDGSIPAQIGDVRVEIKAADGSTIDTNELEVIDAMVVNPVINLHLGTNAPATQLSIPQCTLWQLEGALQHALVGQKLLPDFTLVTYNANPNGSTEVENCFNFELPASALDGNKGMKAEFSVVIYFDFVQYNQVVTPPNA